MVDGRRYVVAVGARADEKGNRARRDVARRQPPELALDVDLALAIRQVDEIGEELVARYVGEEIVDASDADARQHRLAIGVGERQVAHHGASATKAA
jgi:hypothetical protein